MTGEAITAAPAPAPRIQPAEYVAYPDSMKKAKPAEVVSYPTQSAPVAKVEVSSQPAPQLQATEVAVAQVMTPIDLSNSGLTLIETDPNKAASIAPVPESREHAPRRRQRQREVYTIENSEPLQQVETQSPN